MSCFRPRHGKVRSTRKGVAAQQGIEREAMGSMWESATGEIDVFLGVEANLDVGGVEVRYHKL